MTHTIDKTVSILLASYNGSKFISQQLDSIISQSYRAFKLLICDDCSTDDTYEILLKYAAKDKRIELYKNKTNLGFRKNFEKLVSLSKSYYIALCDQDDIWTSDHLSVLIDNIGTHDISCSNSF